MVETAGKLLSEGWNERRRERNEGVNPEEVVEDGEISERRWLGCHCGLSDLKEICLLGCEESESSSGGGEWAWWSGSWWVKTNMRMNSASRMKVHRAISQFLGKSSERNRLCEEKTSDT